MGDKNNRSIRVTIRFTEDEFDLFYPEKCSRSKSDAIRDLLLENHELPKGQLKQIGELRKELELKDGLLYEFAKIFVQYPPEENEIPEKFHDLLNSLCERAAKELFGEVI